MTSEKCGKLKDERESFLRNEGNLNYLLSVLELTKTRVCIE